MWTSRLRAGASRYASTIQPLDLNPWHDFAVASAGAAGALVGLIIVAMSVNIKEIIAGVGLPARAAATISSVAVILVASVVLLVPAQPGLALGVELLVVALAGLAFQVQAARPMVANAAGAPAPVRVAQAARPMVANAAGAPAPVRVAQAAIGVLQLLLVVTAAVLILVGSHSGLYLLAGAFVLIFVLAITNAWVLMVEILR